MFDDEANAEAQHRALRGEGGRPALTRGDSLGPLRFGADAGRDGTCASSQPFDAVSMGDGGQSSSVDGPISALLDLPEFREYAGTSRRDVSRMILGSRTRSDILMPRRLTTYIALIAAVVLVLPPSSRSVRWYRELDGMEQVSVDVARPGC